MKKSFKRQVCTPNRQLLNASYNLFVIKKDICDKKKMFDYVLMRIHLKRVPTRMTSWEALYEISKPTGVLKDSKRPYGRDEDEKNVNVMVLINLKEEMPTGMWAKVGDKKTRIGYAYSIHPKLCKICRIPDHGAIACKPVDIVATVKEGATNNRSMEVGGPSNISQQPSQGSENGNSESSDSYLVKVQVTNNDIPNALRIMGFYGKEIQVVETGNEEGEVNSKAITEEEFFHNLKSADLADPFTNIPSKTNFMEWDKEQSFSLGGGGTAECTKENSSIKLIRSPSIKTSDRLKVVNNNKKSPPIIPSGFEKMLPQQAV